MEDKNESANAIEQSRNKALETISDTIGDLVTGIPAPVRKNAFKAFAQLCTAAIDVPVAQLEGMAAERRAETAARVKLISTGANQISDQMDVDPEYARVAVKKFGQKIVQQQVNLDRISETAAEMLNAKTSENDEADKTPESTISDDWLNNFQKEAEQVTSDEMRILFSKVLAGEIKKPSSFSIRTIRLLSQLDNEAASIFQRFCSMCVALRVEDQIFDARVISLGGNAGSNSLQSYGLNFGLLNVLQEYGLIVSDYHSYMDYSLCINNEGPNIPLGFFHQGTTYRLTPQDGRDQIRSSDFKVNGVMLSKAGKELFRVVELVPVEAYTIALKQFFESQKLEMVEVSSPFG